MRLNIGATALRRSKLTEEIGGPGEKDLALACEKLSLVLGSGLPVAGTIRMVAAETGSRSMRRMLNGAADRIEEGSSVAAALEQAGSLPPLLTETVRAGEESGTLPASFQALARYFRSRENLRRKVSAALSYPVFVAAAALVVVVVIMVKLVPALGGVFAEMGTSLPPVTRALMVLSQWFLRHWPALGILTAAVVTAFLMLSVGEKSGLLLSRLRLALPILGRFETLRSAAQFSSAMAALLAAGLPVTRAMRIASRTLKSSVLAGEARNCAGEIEAGRALSDSLRMSGKFPPLLAELTGVGEETRTLEESFTLAAGYFEQELTGRADRLVRLIEPVTIGLVALFVFFLLLAVYTPMLSLYGGI